MKVMSKELTSVQKVLFNATFNFHMSLGKSIEEATQEAWNKIESMSKTKQQMDKIGYRF